MTIKSKLYKACIFDMDGTIVDTETLWKNVNRIFLQRRNINDSEIVESLIEKIHGRSSFKIAHIMKSELGIKDSLEDIVKEKRAIAHEIFSHEIEYISGFIEFHKLLEKHHIPTAIATNADAEWLKRTSDALHLNKHFLEHMYSITCVNNICKPSPDIYLYAASKLNISPHLCFAIEDSQPGILAAKAAGMYCVGINTAKNKKILSDADIVVDHYSEIPVDKLLGFKI